MKLSMRRGNNVPSTLLCKECGCQMTIHRPHFRKRELFHIKTMYCYKCKKERDFIECPEFNDINYGGKW